MTTKADELRQERLRKGATITIFRITATGKLQTVALVDEDRRYWFYREGGGHKARIRRLEKSSCEKWDEWIIRQTVTITFTGEEYRRLLSSLDAGMSGMQASHYEYCAKEEEWQRAREEENAYQASIDLVKAQAHMQESTGGEQHWILCSKGDGFDLVQEFPYRPGDRVSVQARSVTFEKLPWSAWLITFTCEDGQFNDEQRIFLRVFLHRSVIFEVSESFASLYTNGTEQSEER